MAIRRKPQRSPGTIVGAIRCAVIERAARETGAIVTVEDHMVTNGLGSAVAECIAESGAACRLTRLGIPDVFSIIGPPPELYHHHGYDATGIERAVQATAGTYRRSATQ